MCSLYSISNNSKLAGHSSFQVVLCTKGSDSSSQHCLSPSSPSSRPSWSSSCSQSKRKKMRSGAPVLGLPSQDNVPLFHPPSSQPHASRASSSLHYPPLARTPPDQPWQQPYQHRRSRQEHPSHGATHWQQFHQHHRHHHSYDASFDHDLYHGHMQGREPPPTHVFARQKRAPSASSLSNEQQHRDAGNRRPSQILNQTNSVHSKSLSHPCSPSQPTPVLSTHLDPSLLSTQRNQRSPACASAVPGTTHVSHPVDTTVISFAAAVAAAATTPPMSSPRSTLSPLFCTQDAATACRPSRPSVAASITVAGQSRVSTLADLRLLSGPPVNEAINYSAAVVASQRSRSADSIDHLSSPMGSSIDSNSNEAFDSDEMDLHHVADSIDVTDSDSSMADAETASYHSTAHSILQSEGDSALKLERKSCYKRKVDRLRAKNAALKSTVAQVKSDLALERQRRSTMDKIYMDIKNDLNQKLESEEIKVINLKAEVEQMAEDMKELKDRLASAEILAATAGKTSSLGYKIGYDSSAFSLLGGISNTGGFLLGHHTNLDLIDGQDDSEEFLLARSCSSSAARGSRTSPINSASLFAPTICSDSEEEDDDQNGDMDEDDQSDNDEAGGAISSSFIQIPRSMTPTSSRGGSVSSSSLPTLVEDAEGMEEVDEEESDTGDNEHDDAPYTMMEIILQRQRSRSSEDDMENAPADANETFETMAQKALFNAIQSKFTVAQAQLQLEELVLKFDARLEQAVDVIAKEISRWWEAERLATGGPISGGWGLEDIIISKETDERASPKIVIEKRVQSFFGPLLLQFVASLSEQRMLLDWLGEHARTDPRWLKNHNAVLVALYKYDVVEAEAVLEWWQALEEPQGVFGHGGNNLRSLNSRFVAWLEDEEDESESEDGASEEEDEDESDSDSDFDDDDDDDDVMSQDEDGGAEAILDFASCSKESKDAGPRPLSPSKAEGGGVSSAETKRRISFCTNNLYYSHNGKMCLKKDPVADENGEVENGSKKKYVQCPPLRVSDDDSNGDGEEEEESDGE